MPLQDLAEQQPDLRTYLRVLRRRKWLIVLVAFLGVAVALAVSFAESTKYSATAQVLVQPSALPSSTLGNNSAPAAVTPTEVQTEVALVTSAGVENGVDKALGVSKAPPVKASEDGTTNIIDITATSSSPQEAANVANDYVNAYVGLRRAQTVNSLEAIAAQIQSKINSLRTTIDNPSTTASVKTALASELAAFQAQQNNLQITSAVGNGGPVPSSAAVPPTKPSSPRPVRNGAIGLVVGILLGVALAFLIDHLDDTLKTREDLLGALPELPVIGIIPAVGDWRDRDSPVLVSLESPRSHASEAYRTLRTSVQFIGLDQPVGMLLVTSPSAAEGKTTTLANLAVATAQAGARVIMVCCDLRRPRLHEFVGQTDDVGLTSVLLGETSLSGALIEVPGVEGLSLLASGPLPPNPADLLSSPRAAEVLRSLRARADLVLLDSPPVLPVTDALLLSENVDAMVLVASAGTTTRRDLVRSVELMAQCKAPLLGTVLNGVSQEGTYGAGSYGYKYGYAYSDGARAADTGESVVPTRVG